MRTQQQHRAIAYLAHSIRPDWDEPGILRVLDRVDPAVDLAALTHAALTAAARRHDQTSPAIIAMTGDHWTPCIADRPSIAQRTWRPGHVSDREPLTAAEIAHYAAQARAARRKEQP